MHLYIGLTGSDSV